MTTPFFIDQKTCAPFQNATTHTGKPLHLVFLDKSHINTILAVQDHIYTSLPEAHKAFILPKSAAFFAKHFETGGHILGAVSEKELVAQAIILNPSKDHPKTGMTDMAPLDGEPEDITVLQGLLVRPSYRGQKIAHMLGQAWLDIAQAESKTNLLCEVAMPNSHSWAVFLDLGLHIVSAGIDPDDGTKLYNMHHTTHGLKTAFRDAATGQKICGEKTLKMDEEDRISALLAEGYVGCGWHMHTEPVIHFKPRQESDYKPQARA